MHDRFVTLSGFWIGLCLKILRCRRVPSEVGSSSNSGVKISPSEQVVFVISLETVCEKGQV
jgi:hypothetical protein